MTTPSDLRQADPPHVLINASDSVQIAVHDLGGPAESSAPVLLFSHATGFHGRVWEPMASVLSRRFRCLAIDHRGHGLSELPDGSSLDWARMGDDTVAVLDSDLIGDDRTVHGVGHSMGGAALALAAGRRSKGLRSLWLYEPVIVPPGALPSGTASNPMADGAQRRRASFDSYHDAVSHYSSKFPLNELHPDALRAYVMGGFAQQSDGSVRLRCAPATEAAVFRGAGESGVWDVFSRLEQSIAIVAGRPEAIGPSAFVPEIVRAQPGATLVEYPEYGHFGPLEAPAAMARDLESWVESLR
jgi:pimeloyl-ACP methyl ester carboxylesterase